MRAVVKRLDFVVIVFLHSLAPHFHCRRHFSILLRKGRCDQDRVNIFSLQQPAVIVVANNVAGADLAPGMLVARLVKVTDGGLYDVVLCGMALLAADVGQTHRRAVRQRRRAAKADVTDRDPIIRSDHPSRRRRRALTVNRRFERVRGGNHRGGCRGFLYEIPARLRPGQ